MRDKNGFKLKKYTCTCIYFSIGNLFTLCFNAHPLTKTNTNISCRLLFSKTHFKNLTLLCEIQFYSTSNCRVDYKTNHIFWKFWICSCAVLQLLSMIKKRQALFCTCTCAQLTYKTSCKSLGLLILYPLKTVLLMQFLTWASQFKTCLHFWSTCVQDGRTSPSNESNFIRNKLQLYQLMITWDD